MITYFLRNVNDNFLKYNFRFEFLHVPISLYFSMIPKSIWSAANKPRCLAPRQVDEMEIIYLFSFCAIYRRVKAK